MMRDGMTDHSDSTGHHQDNTQDGRQTSEQANSDTLLAVHTDPTHTRLRHVPAYVHIASYHGCADPGRLNLVVQRPTLF